jgi:hypothetical protein
MRKNYTLLRKVKSSGGKRAERHGGRRGDARNGNFEMRKKYTLLKKVQSSGGKRAANRKRSGAGSGAEMRETVFLKFEKNTLCKGR